VSQFQGNDSNIANIGASTVLGEGVVIHVRQWALAKTPCLFNGTVVEPLPTIGNSARHWRFDRNATSPSRWKMVGYVERQSAVNVSGNNAVANSAYSSGSITLQPGEYDVYGMIGVLSFGSLTTVTGLSLAVRDTTATAFAGTSVGDNRLDSVANSVIGGSCVVGPWRIVVTTATTYHAVGQVAASGGAGTWPLRIIANKVG